MDHSDQNPIGKAVFGFSPVWFDASGYCCCYFVLIVVVGTLPLLAALTLNAIVYTNHNCLACAHSHHSSIQESAIGSGHNNVWQNHCR